MSLLENARRKFFGLFRVTPRVFWAPGRVNLIGGHLDYNEGWVLPIAIDRSCFVCAQKRNDRRLRIYSMQMDELFEGSVDDPRPALHHWSNYVRGAAWALGVAGEAVFGADLCISTEVPMGAGLGSSAALEVGAALALVRLSDYEIDRVWLAQICQRAENEYAGMRCGIMDQLMACCGRRGHALLIDCRTLAIEPVPFDETQVAVVVANTMVKHALAGSSNYNRRRQECEEAVEAVRAKFPDVKSLRDVTWEQIEEMASAWPENVRRRARHVTSEIRRVHAAAEALRNRDYQKLGSLMLEAHESLDRDYEVSSAELNLMVMLAGHIPGFLGGRMTGAGFGGCTVNLVRRNDATDFAAELAAEYEEQAGKVPEIYICNTSDGAAEIV
jgi:galactokinase